MKPWQVRYFYRDRSGLFAQFKIIEVDAASKADARAVADPKFDRLVGQVKLTEVTVSRITKRTAFRG